MHSICCYPSLPMRQLPGRGGEKQPQASPGMFVQMVVHGALIRQTHPEYVVAILYNCIHAHAKCILVLCALARVFSQADIIVGSLVRCNPDGQVGFLGEPERMTVFLSRARCGMIIIGSARTLREARNPAARQHWGKVLGLLAESNSIHAGLPAVCQQHKRPILPVLDTPQAFAQRAPHGGCLEPCGATLPCGHLCPLRCHASDPTHRNVRCQELVYVTCSEGHQITRLCCEPNATCETCVQIRKIQQKAREDLQKLVSCCFHGACMLPLDASQHHTIHVLLCHASQAAQKTIIYIRTQTYQEIPEHAISYHDKPCHDMTCLSRPTTTCFLVLTCHITGRRGCTQACRS